MGVNSSHLGSGANVQTYVGNTSVDNAIIKSNDNNNEEENNFNIYVDHTEDPSSRSKDSFNLSNDNKSDNNEESKGLWEITEDIQLNKKHTTKLLKIVKNNYKQKEYCLILKYFSSCCKL